MKKLIKKIAAIAVTAAMLLSLAGCSDVSTAGTIQGESIKAGVYIYYELQAAGEFSTKYAEANPDVSTSEEGFTYNDKTVDGVLYADWVKAEALNLLKKHVAIGKMFTENGLSLTAEETADLKTNINATWDNENQYLSYFYGIDAKSWGEYYESIGVAKTSYQECVFAAKKEDMLFNKFFEADGLTPATEDELKTYFSENYARYRAVEVSLKDANGDAITTDEGLKIMEDLANGYVAELQSGKSFADVAKEYETYVADQTAAAEADDTDGTSNAAATDSGDLLEAEEVTDEASGSEVTADEEEAEPVDTDYDKIIAKTATSPSADFVSHVFAMENGKPELYKTESTYYVLVRLDILENASDLEDYRTVVLHAVKDDAMEQNYKDYYADFTADMNAAAVALYDPTTMRT